MSHEFDHRTTAGEVRAADVVGRHPASSARRQPIWRALYAGVMSRAERWFGLRLFRVRARPLVGTRSLPPLPSGWSVRQVTRQELVGQLEVPELHLGGAFFESSASTSAIMTGVFRENRLVSYAFATSHGVPAADGMWVRCEHPYRYSFKSFTHPEYRGRRLSTYASLASDSMFLNRGYTHAISYTDTHNFASINTESSKGNVLIGFAGYVKIGSICFAFRSPGCRRVGFGFYHPNDERRLPLRREVEAS
jgi:hypothetical protein